MEDPQPSSGDIASPTFADAFASDEPDQTAAASPAPQTDPSAPPAPDTTVPGDGSDSLASDTGPIPYERHKAILEGERQKAAQLQAQYAWIPPGLDAQQGAAMVQWFAEARRDPVAFLRKLEQELKAHPQFGRQLQMPQPADEEPPPDLTAENGKPVYSADQLRAWGEWRDRQMEARWTKRFEPYEQERQQRDIQTTAERRVAEQLGEMQQFDTFEGLKRDVAELLKDGRVTLPSAFLRVLHEKYLPQLKQMERERVLAELQTKGHASTINPSKSTGTIPKDYRVLGFGPALEDSGG